MLPRKPDERISQAKEMYLKGMKLVEIASQLNLPEGTIRSWKNRQKWDCNVAFLICNVAIPFLSVLPAADCTLRQIQLTCNLNQLHAIQVHLPCLVHSFVRLPWQPHHLSIVSFKNLPGLVTAL